MNNKHVSLISFTRPSVPGVYAKYEGIRDALQRSGYKCELENINGGRLLYYIGLGKSLLFRKSDIFWFRFNLEKALLLIAYQVILRIRGKRIIIEIPTAFSSHVRTKKSVGTFISYYFFAPIVLIMAGKVLTYSRENGHLSRFNRKMDLVGNGTSPDRVPTKSKANTVEDCLNIVAVGSMAPWHGFEQLLEALANLPHGSKFELNLVGDGPVLDDLRRLATKLNLSDKVNFHGYLNPSQLTLVYSRCNLACGSLNWGSIGVTESSPIKHREYSLAGLPFFHVGLDVDYVESPVSFQLPGEDVVVELKNLLEQVLRGLELPTPQACRDYAFENLMYDAKVERYIS